MVTQLIVIWVVNFNYFIDVQHIFIFHEEHPIFGTYLILILSMEYLFDYVHCYLIVICTIMF